MVVMDSMNGLNQLLFINMAQAVSVGAWLPIVILIILLLLIVGLAYRGMLKNARRPQVRKQSPSLSERNEQLKQNLAEIQARNQAELDQTRAILREAQASGGQVVDETREGVIRATREETERARAEIIRAREQHLAELRQESARIGQDESPPENPTKP